MRGSRKDNAVEKAYLRRITGYEVTETKTEYKFTEEGGRVPVKATESTKHVPGDARAAEFWLTNRKPEQWKPSRLLGAAEGGEESEGGVVELPEVSEPEEEG